MNTLLSRAKHAPDTRSEKPLRHACPPTNRGSPQTRTTELPRKPEDTTTRQRTHTSSAMSPRQAQGTTHALRAGAGPSMAPVKARPPGSQFEAVRSGPGGPSLVAPSSDLWSWVLSRGLALRGPGGAVPEALPAHPWRGVAQNAAPLIPGCSSAVIVEARGWLGWLGVVGASCVRSLRSRAVNSPTDLRRPTPYLQLNSLCVVRGPRPPH